MMSVIPSAKPFLPHGEIGYPTPILVEMLSVVEFAALRLSPAYYGYGIPHGDQSAAVVLPGLIGWDIMLLEMHAWLGRIGYRPYFSGLGFVADCPNLLAKRLSSTIDRAYAETGRRVHLIGHSLGGIFARSLAVQRPDRIASVISLGSPFRGLVAHDFVFTISDVVRNCIQERWPDLPTSCATSRCPCAFGRSLQQHWPSSVFQTTMYSRNDGLVDWRYCLTGRPDVDIEVYSTHLGMPFNAGVYLQIAHRLALARPYEKPVRRSFRRKTYESKD